MILTQSPHFPTQDDSGTGVGIAPIAQWLKVTPVSTNSHIASIDGLNIEPATSETLRRLHEIFSDANASEMSTTDFHDLTCFVLHRLLGQAQMTNSEHGSQAPILSECMRNALVLYMLIIHGPTYFSHAGLQHKCVQYLRARLEDLLPPLLQSHTPVALWLLSVCMVASKEGDDFRWFSRYAGLAIRMLRLRAWEAILTSLRTVLWFNQSQAESLFRKCWIAILEGNET